MSEIHHRAILDAVLAALRDGPMTTIEVVKALEPNSTAQSYLYPRTYARLRKLEGEGSVQRLRLEQGRIAWIRTSPPEPDDLEDLWALPPAGDEHRRRLS